MRCRTLLCERGLLQRADGSARWSQDKTSVLAAVYGPCSTFGRKEDSEKAVVEVFFKPHAGLYRYSAPGKQRAHVRRLCYQLIIMLESCMLRVQVILAPRLVKQCHDAGQVENDYQRCIRKAVQGVFAASMHPRTAVQVTIQVMRLTNIAVSLPLIHTTVKA